jgi:hypothetical protein
MARSWQVAVAAALLHAAAAHAAPAAPGDTPCTAGTPDAPCSQGLVASGSLPAGTVDFMGDTLGSFSSMAVAPGSWRREGDTYTAVLWTLPDRGANDPEHGVFFDYAGRLNRFRLTVTPAAPGAARVGQVTLVPDGGLALKDFNGASFTGADPGQGTVTQQGVVLPSPASGTGQGKVSLDAESLQFIRGGGFYVGDEYAANVYRFDAAGRLQGVVQPPRAVQPVDADGRPAFTSLKPPATGRRNNQGIEGMSLSPDGRWLFVVPQSALVQDTRDGAVGRSSTRVLVYDTSKGTTPLQAARHYIVQLPVYDDAGRQGTPNRTAAQSEVRALDDHRFLMLARDSAGWGASDDKPVVFKRVLLVDTTHASNLAGTPYETGTASVLTPDGHLKEGLRPATWTSLVDLVDPQQLRRAGLSVRRGDDGLDQVSEKWEAMDLVPVLDPEHPYDWFLLVGNDNDFMARHCVMDGHACNAPIDNDNRILVFRLTLPGMRSTPATSHH